MNIGTALNVGYTIANVLSFLSGNYPNLGKKIKEAQKLGYDVEKIVKTFSNMTTEDLEKYDKSLSSNSGNPWIDALNIQEKRSASVKGKEYLKKGAKIAGLAAIPLAAYGLQRYLNKPIYPDEIQEGNKELPAPDEILGLENQPPEEPTSPTPPPTSPLPVEPTPIPTQDADIVPQGVAPQTLGQQIGQGIQAPITDALQPTNLNQIAEASQAIPNQMQQQIPIFEQLLGGIDPSTLEPEKQQQLKFLSLISDQLQSKGKTINDPEFIKLGKKIKDIVKGKPGLIVEENARFNAGQEAKQANVKPLDMEEVQEQTNITEPAKITKPESIKKGESVVTENGNIAEVKGTSGNNFLIEENGKIRQVPMDSLKSQPEAIKKAKIVFDPSKVPESERSAALAISLPMPDRSSIINMFHDGSFYVYRRKDGKPIDDSIVRRIIDGQDIPLSTGETFMGAWNQDTGDSRGSASFKELTKMAQDATKPDDPTKPLIFEKISDVYTHGYLKEFMKLLKETGKNFSAKSKKQKK